MIEYFGVPGGIAAALVTAAALSLLHPVALRWHLVDVPRGRKTHAGPTPYTGGIAILLGVSVAVIAAATIDIRAHLGFALGCVLLGVVGLLDDKFDIRWYWRVLVQVVAALCMVYIDGIRVEQLGPALGLGDGSLGVLSVPITVLATVGLVNAVNMVDGIDGAAGCLVATALALLAGAAWYSGNAPVAQSAVLLLGAIVAFLAFNLRFPWQPRARCFLGNAGSAFLGFAIAWLAFRLTQNANHPVSAVLAIWFIPIPVMDTLVLMVRRIRTGRSPFDADRNHIHHLIEEAGVGPTRASILLALVSLACGLVAGQALRLDVPEQVLLAAFGVACVGWYWLTRFRTRAVKVIAALLSTHRHEAPAPHPAGMPPRPASPVVSRPLIVLDRLAAMRAETSSAGAGPRPVQPGLRTRLRDGDRDIALAEVSPMRAHPPPWLHERVMALDGGSDLEPERKRASAGG